MNNIQSLNFPTMSGLKSLDLDVLSVSDKLTVDNIDGQFFSIDTIEADNLQINNQLHLTASGFISVGDVSPVFITDTQISYLSNLSSDVQEQINNIDIDTSSIILDVSQNKIDISENAYNIDLIENNIINIENDINTAESNIVTLQNDINTAESNIVTLQNDINTAESNIVTLHNNIDLIENDIVTIENDISTAESNIVTLQNDINSAESNIVTLQNDINIAETNIISNDLDITALQLKTQYIGYSPNLILITRPLVFTNANISVSFNALRIESVNDGIVLNPGGSKIVNISSNNVVMGRATCNFTLAGTSVFIMNGETQNFAFTTARKNMIETNTTNININSGKITNIIQDVSTNAYDISTIIQDVSTNAYDISNIINVDINTLTQNVLANTNYIADVPFIYYPARVDLFKNLSVFGNITLFGNVECLDVVVADEYEFKAQKGDGSIIYSINNILNDMNIQNKKSGGNISLETLGAGLIYANNVDVNDALGKANTLYIEYEKERISFDEDYTSDEILQLPMLNSTSMGSATASKDMDIGFYLKSNNTYWDISNNITKDFGTLNIMVNMNYEHSSTSNAFVWVLQFQLLIIASSGQLRYDSKRNGHKTNNDATVVYNYYSVNQSLVIPYQSNYLGCKLVIRTYYHFQLPEATNHLKTNIQIHSI